MQAIITANNAFLLHSHLKINPANKPAKPVLSKQTKTVTTGLKFKKNTAPGKTEAPTRTPTNKPAYGPYTQAATTIGINANVILAIPIDAIKFDKNCKAIANADSKAIPVICLILLLFFILLIFKFI